MTIYFVCYHIPVGGLKKWHRPSRTKKTGNWKVDHRSKILEAGKQRVVTNFVDPRKQLSAVSGEGLELVLYSVGMLQELAAGPLIEVSKIL